jgi:hypothetical protein
MRSLGAFRIGQILKIHLVLIGVVILAILGCSVDKSSAPEPSPEPTAVASAPATANGGSTCLRCHPWDKVMEASTKYVVASSGEKANPHMYVPHDSKEGKDIPDCMKCHTTHALSPAPAKGSIDLSKLDVKWCFDACHHEKNFEPCKKCH